VHDETTSDSASHHRVPLQYVAFPPERLPRRDKTNQQLDPGEGGYVLAPVLLRSRQKPDRGTVLKLDCRVNNVNWLMAWPQSHATPSILEGPADWRLSPKGHWERSVALLLCTPPLRSAGEIAALVRVRDGVGRVLCERTLTWSDVRIRRVDVTLDWPELESAMLMNRHPVGAQRLRKWAIGRIANRSSFAISAPRRFGKSTLMRHIDDALRRGDQHSPQGKPLLEGKRHAVVFIDCLEHYRGRIFDDQRLWRSVGDQLKSPLGVGLEEAWTPAGLRTLPAASAFDRAREEAARKGLSAIVLLLDEAQAMFTGEAPEAFGAALRTMLQSVGVGTPVAAPVVVGMAGLSSLSSARIGADLTSLTDLNVINELEDEEISALIKGVTSGVLFCTREARQLLIRTSNNLLIFRRLLTQLIRRAEHVERMWVNYDDVNDEICKLEDQLARGHDTGITPFLKDMVSTSDDIKVFEPISAFVVAVAVSVLRRERTREPVTEERVLDLINQWVDNYFARDSIKPLYTRRELEAHLSTLRGRRLLNGALEVESRLLEAWLYGASPASGSPTPASDFRLALYAGGVERIRVPLDASPTGAGKQATVSRWQRSDGRVMAVRRVKLADAAERGAFLEGCALLSRVQRIVNSHARGSQYVFRLEAMGLSESSEAEGVQLYEWVDGVDLHGQEGRLPAVALIDLGRRLSEALALLHEREIVHRDIRPANIILRDSDFSPVLIDFGLARAITQSRLTEFGGDFVAPEVRGDADRAREPWGPAADVFSFGKTLSYLLDPTSAHASLLRDRIIRPSMAVGHTSRPAAQALLRVFESLAAEVAIDAKRQAVVDAVERALATADGDPVADLANLVRGKMREAIIPVGLGGGAGRTHPLPSGSRPAEPAA
jgi:hypothetical protein